jgi:repressor LexA
MIGEEPSSLVAVPFCVYRASISSAKRPRVLDIVGAKGLDGERSNTVHVPIVGRIAAGQPILAAEDLEGTVPVDRRFGAGRRLFALRVQGYSMINAGILEGDLVIAAQQQDAQDGDIVVALVDDEATVKRFHRRRDGAVELRPENPRHKPIVIEEPPFMIQGRVVAVQREIQE